MKRFFRLSRRLILAGVFSSRGAFVNAPDREGHTPLDLAAPAAPGGRGALRSSDPEILRLLRLYGGANSSL